MWALHHAILQVMQGTAIGPILEHTISRSGEPCGLETCKYA